MSPIIAEILLVTITVVLAGIVYFAANSFSLQAATPARPFVAFGPVIVEDGVATIKIAGVSRTAAPENYRANLAVGGVLGKATSLLAAGTPATLSIRDETYQVAWTDAGTSGLLASGDPITIRDAAGALPSSTAFTFYLIWSDGAVLQTTSWTT